MNIINYKRQKYYMSNKMKNYYKKLYKSIISKMNTYGNGKLCCPVDAFKVDNSQQTLISNSLESISTSNSNSYTYIDPKFLNETQNNYESNKFVDSLKSFFDEEEISETIRKYKVGTSNTYEGATIFWYIDINKRICEGEVMKYEYIYKESLSKDKRAFIKHKSSILSKEGTIKPEFNRKSILFGEHLLLKNNKPIAIVQNEKTAIVSSMYFPEYTWLATGSFSDLTYGKIKTLIGEDVTLCPNKGNFFNWFGKSIEYDFKISTVIKENFKHRNPRNANLTNLIMDSIQIEEYSRYNSK